MTPKWRFERTDTGVSYDPSCSQDPWWLSLLERRICVNSVHPVLLKLHYPPPKKRERKKIFSVLSVTHQSIRIFTKVWKVEYFSLRPCTILELILSVHIFLVGQEHVWQCNWFSKRLPRGYALTYIIHMFYGKEQHSNNPLLTFCSKCFLNVFPIMYLSISLHLFVLDLKLIYWVSTLFLGIK